MPDLSPGPSAGHPPPGGAPAGSAVPAAPPSPEGTAAGGFRPDAAEDIAAVNALRSAVMRLSRRLKHQRVDESLSPTEMSVLGTLFRCGSATPGELARKEHVQPPSMTRIVALLEAKGLVRLEPHPEDRRQKLVTQTEQAEAMLEQSRRKRNAWLAGLAEELDEDDWAKIRAAAPVLEKLAHL